MKNAKAIAYDLTFLFATSTPGEAFHKDYAKNQELFRQLVKSDNLLERKLRKYFKELSTTIEDKVDWAIYNRTLKASILDMIQSDWEEETLNLRVILTDSLIHAIVAGGVATELETGIVTGWSSKSPAALDFLSKYTIKLSGNLTETTVDRIKSSLQSSLSTGKNQYEAASAISQIIDDPYRASMIAHTESIRAYSEGRLEVAEEVGADRKMWSATAGACPICEPLDGAIVGLDEDFEDGSDSPPAHPNCRCLVRILMPGE